MDSQWTATLRIDSLSYDNWGHAWLTIAGPSGHRVDVGYYPIGNMINSPGRLLMQDTFHQVTQDTAYTFHISAGQAAKLLDAAEQIQAHPGTYRVAEHNCLSVARDLLVHAGVNMPPIDG